MKTGWKLAKLGDVCHVYQPETLSQKQLKDGPYPVYGANGQIGFHAEFNHAEPQLTLGCRGTCGVVNWTTENAWINGNAMVVKAVAELVIPQFLSYALMGGVNIGDSITGTAQPQITRKSLSPIEIPLPPLAEQKLIVALLNEAFAEIDEAKAKTECSRKAATDLLRSYLHFTFTQSGQNWAEASLGETCDMYQPKTIATKDLVPDGAHPVFGANGIIGRYDKFNHAEPQLTLGCRGTCGVVNWTTENAWITGNAMVIRSKVKELNTHFLEFLFRGGIDISIAITGTAQPQITRTNLETVKIRFPRLVSEQMRLVKKFVSMTEDTRRLGQIYAQKIDALSELKKTLLIQAFAGDLTP